MKIILTAFGELLRSSPMDIPETSGTTWEMVLTQPIQAFVGYEGDVISTKPEFHKRCRFEWTGMMQYGARVYALTDM